MTHAPTLLGHLNGVRQTGAGRWIAKCPSHEDHSPSSSIRELDDGRLLIYDFGGCDTEAVLAAVGLTFNDLFERPLPDLPPAPAAIPARDLLVLLDHELTVAVLILGRPGDSRGGLFLGDDWSVPVK
jgi:hypothetical protein